MATNHRWVIILGVGVAETGGNPSRVLVVTLATPMFWPPSYHRGYDAENQSTVSFPNVKHREPAARVVCQLPPFCVHSQMLAESFQKAGVTADVGVLSATVWPLARECPGATLVVPDERFLRAADMMWPDPNSTTRNCKYCVRCRV